MSLVERTQRIAATARVSHETERERNRRLSPDFARWTDEFTQHGKLVWLMDLETGKEWGTRRKWVKVSPPQPKGKVPRGETV